MHQLYFQYESIMTMLTCSVFVVLVVVSPILCQPWVPTPNPQQGWMPWLWMDRFNANVEYSRVNGSNIHLVFYGDSITELWPQDIWNRAYAPFGAVNYGILGDATQNVLWRIINGEVDNISPRVVVVKIGTIDQKRGRKSFEVLIQSIFKAATILDRIPHLTLQKVL